MVKTNIFSNERGAYVAPVSKTYSVVLESVIAQSGNYGDAGKAGGDLGEGSTYDL